MTSMSRHFCEMLRRRGEFKDTRILGPRTIELMTKNHLMEGKDVTQLMPSATFNFRGQLKSIIYSAIVD